MSLKGKTIFITGATRGIGKAIAIRAAKDGANIVIAAKTVTPHPSLEGTIHTAAEEVRKAGGKCLACVCDIRFEDQIKKAIDETIRTFGGIDILVNNASAINLTGTLETDMKKFDLMHSINLRGTYLVSKLCLPYLLKSSNPHILNLSPPLTMQPKWFQHHVAYTMAKYGMSMCVLGMAAEFKDQGVAVNALWPRTMIATAAVQWMGGDAMMKASRKPDIMADAAYWILTQKSTQCTGNFFVDEDLLRKTGVTDFEHYANVPGEKLGLDFFLPDEDVQVDFTKDQTIFAKSKL